MLTRAPEDPEVLEFEATVTAVDGRAVELDETYFYAESGGQPSDRGTVDGVPVEHVYEAAETVVHTLESTPDFEAGDDVVCAIDEEFRTYCMRAHTASHALYGAGRRLLDDLGYGGFDISAEKVRVDFTTTTDIDDEVLVELERLTNRAVWESRDVSWDEVPTAEATERDDVAFNTKTEEGVMDDADTVRIVEIDGWDVAACGGTHVSNTREIGPVTVLGRSNPGEGLTRVEFAVGPSGIDHWADVHRAALDAATRLDASVEELGEAAARLQSENESLSDDLQEAESALLGVRLGEFDTFDRDGATWRLGVLDGFGPNEAGEAAKSAVGDGADVVAVVGDQSRPYLVVAAAAGGDIEAGDEVERVTEAFGGGGGGGPTFAQGGGIDATPEDVVDFLKGEP
jgi:alanyl-tRNA synthetase